MSRVVVVRYDGADLMSGLSVRQYRDILQAGLSALGSNFLKDRLLGRAKGKSTTVGIKPNCLAKHLNSTPVALANALIELLVEAGVSENNTVVWERSNRELSEAGYELNASFAGRRCLGTDTNGVGYSSEFYTSGDVNSLVTKILTEMVDININLPVLKDHSLAGMSAGLKNMYGAIHNPNKYHGDNCNPFCAHVSNLDPIRKKNRLTVIDAVRVQYHGGPGFIGDYFYHYGGVILSEDPVACDTVGLQILEKIRKDKGLPPLDKAGRPVKYLASANQIGLGEAVMDKIEVETIRLGIANMQ
ncbi:MAG: DUF362 domain-containing protein [Candidatus Zixiibacteriota bacterium]